MTRSLCVLFILVAAPASANDSDNLLKPKNGQFSVRFPGKPKEDTESTKTAAGTVKIYTATYALPDGSVFLASFVTFPAGVAKPESRDALFDGVVKGLTGKDGKLQSEKEVAVGAAKEPGREVLIDKGKQHTRTRMALRENRLIQVGVVGSEAFISGKLATAFLDSLEFTK